MEQWRAVSSGNGGSDDVPIGAVSWSRAGAHTITHGIYDNEDILANGSHGNGN